MASLPNVIKANGLIEPFDPSKLERSLLRAKADPMIVSKIIDHIGRETSGTPTTSQIYKHAFFLLNKFQRPAAYKYSIREALAALGPSGFPFEKFVAEILKAQGFTTEVDQQVKGGCTTHEVDVVAWNDLKLLMVEAKFHNQRGIKCDLKVALYVKARFDDLLEATHFVGGKRRPITDNWLITNTSFTSTAIEYALCKGLTMIGYNYPEKGNLHDMIEDGDLMPITCLHEVHSNELRLLLNKGLVLCKQIRDNVTILQEVGIPQDRAKKIVEEIAAIH
ncbi:MAG TPA: restriction endonuclease [Candidatus Nanoarchaeia archaeon]|nr:restriction endonuclease [Candidatus Nanoarchaeia archaeon]